MHTITQCLLASPIPLFVNLKGKLLPVFTKQIYNLASSYTECEVQTTKNGLRHFIIIKCYCF